MAETTRPFEGKSAIVTGSARRVGRAIAERLAADGASVVINSRSARDECEEAAHAIEAAGGRAIVNLGDVTNPDDVAAMVDAAVSAFGRLDIMVHNAFLRRRGTLDELSLDEWHDVMAVVLDGGFLTAKYAAPELRKTAGNIVLIGGLTAFMGALGPATPTAKAGLVGLMRSLVQELGPDGVRVNLVSLGRIEGEGDDPARTAASAANRPVERIPLRRPGNPEDVADAVAAVCGDDMRYVTGQTFHLAGGIYMG